MRHRSTQVVAAQRSSAHLRSREVLRRVVVISAEALERRVLLAAVSWDGGGDRTNWTDPLNWSANQVPGAADDVSISVPSSPTVRIGGGTHSVNSLVSEERFELAGG